MGPVAPTLPAHLQTKGERDPRPAAGQMLGQLGCRPRQRRQNSDWPEQDGTERCGEPTAEGQSRVQALAKGPQRMRRQSAPAEPWVGERERGRACEDMRGPGGWNQKGGGVRTVRGPIGTDLLGAVIRPRHWGAKEGSEGRRQDRSGCGWRGSYRWEQWVQGIRGSCNSHGKREGVALETDRQTHMSPEKTRTRGHRGTQTLTAAPPVKAPTTPPGAQRQEHAAGQAGRPRGPKGVTRFTTQRAIPRITNADASGCPRGGDWEGT